MAEFLWLSETQMRRIAPQFCDVAWNITSRCPAGDFGHHSCHSLAGFDGGMRRQSMALIKQSPIASSAGAAWGCLDLPR